MIITVGFRFSDINEIYGVQIRRGVAQVDAHLPEKSDLTLTLDKLTLERIQLGQLTMREAVHAGVVQVTDGRPTDIERFFGYFEIPFSNPIRLVVR